MPRTLDVYLRRDLVGNLMQDAHGELAFAYAASWLANQAAIPLSHSLPLRKERFNRHACKGFFAGVLPDQGKREIIAKNLGISPRNDFAMLEQIGGECAGAVTFIPAGENLPDRNYHYRPLTGKELGDILKELPKRPLMAGAGGIRLSLAGAQDKIAVHVASTQISVPLGGAPSTHIIKPAIERFAGLVFNEAFCMKLARAIGIPTASADVGRAGDIDYLIIQRYDRAVVKASTAAPEYLERLHQEDFCQALGIDPDHKYQREGGPSLKQCFALLRKLSSVPVMDIQHLLDAVIFNFLIGNHDAHGKNFSLLYDAETRLAPLYDVVSTVGYPELDRKMAMKIGGEYVSDQVRPGHFERLADEAGLAKPLVKRRVREVAAAMLEKSPGLTSDLAGAFAVASLIQGRCQRVMEEFI
jgi:serine/threonine-protein kinase HipA